MSQKINPMDFLKNLPNFNGEMLQDFLDMDWADPQNMLKNMGQSAWPPVDVVETGTEVIISAAIPGLQHPADVRVELAGNKCTLEGELHPDFLVSPSAQLHQQEKNRGKFSRSITLPAAVNPKGATASYQRGILEIRVGKFPEGQAQSLNVEFGD